jgi:hypothetical protein
MPRRSAILPSATLAFVMVAALSTQTIRTTLAADECLAKPSGPTPQGQHWYYRIDHANNNRQCWRLAPEGLPVQKTAPQSDDATASEPDAQQQARTPQTATAAPAPTPADIAPAGPANSIATAPLAPWPVATKLPALLPVVSQAQAAPQTASADDTAPIVTSDDPPAATNDPSSTGSGLTEHSQRAPAERPQTSAAPPHQFSGIDHTFALLMVMFALLAVTGPILHFTHRQRQRDEVIKYKPPRWAPVVPLNAPAPRIRRWQVPKPAAPIVRRPQPRPVQASDLPQVPTWQHVPDPPRAVEPNERLTHALQQLIDRMQTIQPVQSNAAPGRTRRADVEMLKNAR